MNGLLAIYKKQDIPSSSLKALLNKGLDSLSHRGAKAHTSFLINKKLQYAGQSESSARMAMGSCSQQNTTSHTASYNDNLLFFEGRLLNKKELCKQLAVSAENDISDSEIVLRMIKQDGINCFRSLKGFWSLIYLDSGNKAIYGARDHFGNRPMYFCNTGNHFALSSECRTLYTLFEDSRSINKNTITDFLLWGNIGLSDQYFFNDIHSIEPSHFVKYEIENDRLIVERYYTLPYNRSKIPYDEVSEKQYTDKLRALIADSVHKNLQLTDGPLAIGVSGGMDSSSLICMAKKTDPSRTLVAYTSTDNYDGGEAYWAEKVVRHTGVEWIKVVCTAEQIIENSDAVNRVHSTPLYNPSSLAQYRIMEEVKKQGQAVFIDGQGGDEMLGGYPAYFPLFLQSLRKNGEWRSWWKELGQVGNSGMTKKEVLTRCLKLWAKAHYYTPQKLAREKRKHEYEALIPEVRDSYFEYPSPIPQIKKEILNDALFESYTLFLGNILRWGEHSAASHGIECIMPLSDSPELTEFIFSIPSSFKIHNGWNKYLQRKAMIGIVPDEICWRKQKMGFYTPEQKWLNEINKAMFDAIQKTDDPEECIHKKYIIENWNRLYTSSNLLFQQFCFRCYSYLLWRNGL
ncbi:MAG: asparagine synthase [Tannerella sp.]|jgi:asparagine synthase (glutamine-hydrolysing)|nr:asparagine synthase [Tannerella sp.]